MRLDLREIPKESPNEGLEPSTLRLRVWCSTDWASRELTHSENDVTQSHWRGHDALVLILASIAFSFSRFDIINPPSGKPLWTTCGAVEMVGAVAQMVERSLSMWEVRGSIPCSSNDFFFLLGVSFSIFLGFKLFRSWLFSHDENIFILHSYF